MRCLIIAVICGLCVFGGNLEKTEADSQKLAEKMAEEMIAKAKDCTDRRYRIYLECYTLKSDDFDDLDLYSDSELAQLEEKTDLCRKFYRKKKLTDACASRFGMNVVIGISQDPNYCENLRPFGNELLAACRDTAKAVHAKGK